MHLDDFDRFEVRRRLGCELRGEHGTKREVRRDQNTNIGLVFKLFPHRGEALVVPACRANDSVDAVFDSERDVVRRGRRDGEIHHVSSPRIDHCFERVTSPDLRDHLHVFRIADGSDGLRSHASARADDCDADG